MFTEMMMSTGGGGGINPTFLNDITAIPQNNLTNFTVGKTYFLYYSRGNATEHTILSGADIISEYTIPSQTAFGLYIFKATSTTVTVSGSGNTCYVAQLD